MDVFDEHLGFWPTLQALGIHLIPTLVLIVALIFAWRREWNPGVVVYGVMGVLYLVWVTTLRRPIRRRRDLAGR